MEYVSVSARFLFFNGKERYTVEYTYGISKWFVFEDEQNASCLYSKEYNDRKRRVIDRDMAEDILYEYLQTKS